MIKMTPKMIFAAILLYIQLLSACVPVFCTVYSFKVKNSTRDTLIIGASRYNSIDSVRVFLDLGMVTDIIKIKNHMNAVYGGLFHSTRQHR